MAVLPGKGSTHSCRIAWYAMPQSALPIIWTDFTLVPVLVLKVIASSPRLAYDKGSRCQYNIAFLGKSLDWKNNEHF